MKNHWLFRSYLKLPLWGKVAAPFVALFLLMAAFRMLKWAIGLAIVGIVVYFVVRTFNRYEKSKGLD